MKRVISLITILFALKASCVVDTMTGTLNEYVKTLQVTSAGDIFVLPAVMLGSGQQLDVSFDILADDRDFLRYRVIRCESNWQPSSIAEVEWLRGFNESTIEDYRFSSATSVHYVHYSFKFPNEDIDPLISGNYLIQVYPEDDPEDVWLQQRVMLTEQSASISAFVSSRTDVDYNSAHQQLEIAVDLERANVADPFNDLKVMIAQNGRADNEVVLTHPLRMSGKTAIYEHQQPLIFDAGNEYRRFEVSNVNYPGMRVENIGYYEPYYHFTLMTDEGRAAESYMYDQTQNGRYMVREYNSADSDVDADYVVVHFALNYPEMPEVMIFLDGDFVSRRFDESSRMIFNPLTKRYEKALLLKQGHYNYQYLAVPPGAGSGKTGMIEGNKYQTVNEYVIKIYTRGPLDRTDRLIGIHRLPVR